MMERGDPENALSRTRSIVELIEFGLLSELEACSGMVCGGSAAAAAAAAIGRLKG